MEQETLWYVFRRSVVTNALPRIRARDRPFPRIPKRYRRLAAASHAGKAFSGLSRAFCVASERPAQVIFASLMDLR